MMRAWTVGGIFLVAGCTNYEVVDGDRDATSVRSDSMDLADASSDVAFDVFGDAPPSCLGGCPKDHWDLDGDPSTGTCGCEYACVKKGDGDPIDDAFADDNCDGTDGVVATCVFVSSLAGDDANPGTRIQPMKTINEAIKAAKASSKSVCVGGGTYSGLVTIESGVSLYGGFDEADATFKFRRSLKSPTVLVAPGTVVFAPKVDVATHVEGLTINATTPLGVVGASSYGLRLGGGAGTLFLRYDKIAAEDGTDGASGSPGARGTNGAAGSNGKPSSAGGAATVGPSSTCGAFGGSGGAGGYASGAGTSGTGGGPSGGVGGTGGKGSPNCYGWGSDGALGYSPTSAGEAGTRATALSSAVKGTLGPEGTYSPASAPPGGEGQPGRGGAGGGGGGGIDGGGTGCCLPRYPTAGLSRSVVTPPSRSLALGDRLRTPGPFAQSEAPGRRASCASTPAPS